jgi:hypothetical protein
VVLAGVLAALASGCATVPTGGAPQPLEGQGGQQQAFVQPLPPPGPEPGWSPEDVILGFVQASANFRLDPAAARKYLAHGVQWNPLGKNAAGITVVSANSLRATPLPPRLQGGDVSVTYVTVTGQTVASLTSTGQYRYQPGSPTYTFGLEKSADGVWLIQSLPTGDPLLLTQAAFEQVFQPRNLYFFGSAGTPAGTSAGTAAGILVPDPVFAPVQGPETANTTALATGLVKGLILDQHNWLSGATTNAFPPGTGLLGVAIDNLTAHVDLSMSAATVANLSSTDIAQMYVQLRQTLTTSSYSPRVANSVRLAINSQSINNKLRKVPSSLMTAVVPPVGFETASLYFAGAGTVYARRPSGPAPVVTAGPAQLDYQAGISAAAASWDRRPRLAVAVPYGTGCAVFVGTTGTNAAYRRYRLPARTGPCTSLSWDDGGDLWAVAGSRIWILRAGPSSARLTGPMQVAAPPGVQVLALRMAPDGVRAAMLVHTSAGNGLLMAAAGYGPDSVTFGPAVPVGSAPGSALADPVAVSWYSPDQLVAISQGELYQVPLTGGAPLPLGAPPAGASSITSNGYVIAVGTSAGRVYTSPGPDSPWTLAGPGIAPAYPG